MQYFIKKTFYNLKNKWKQIILFLFLEIVLICSIGLIYKNGTYSLFDVFYGNISLNQANILLLILKLFLLFFQIYLIYYLIIQDLIVSKINIFTRINDKNWYLKKTIVLSVFLFIYKIGHAFILSFLYYILIGKFTFFPSLFFLDLIWAYSLLLAIVSVIIYKNKFYTIFFVGYLLFLIFSYYYNGYAISIAFLVILDILLFCFNLFKINLNKNYFD